MMYFDACFHGSNIPNVLLLVMPKYGQVETRTFSVQRGKAKGNHHE